MARVTHRDFSKGIWLAGGREAPPPGTLRMGRGIRQLLQPSIRSRWGHQLLLDFGTAYSALRNPVRFVNTRFIRSADKLLAFFFQNSFVFFEIATGLSSSEMALHYVKATPTPDTDATKYQAGVDHLFVSGGGLTITGAKGGSRGVFKIDSNGGVSRWGIQPPPLGNATLQPQLSKINGEARGFFPVIDEFDGVGAAPDWVFTGTGVTGTNDFGTVQSGANSVRLTVPPSSAGLLAKIIFKNLFQITPDVQSPKQDWIQLWIYCDEPKNLAAVEILFDVTEGAAPGTATTLAQLKDAYVFQILVEDSVTKESAFDGIADHPDFADTRDDRPLPGGDTVLNDPSVVAAVTEQKKVKKHKKHLGQTVSPSTIDAIVRDLGSTRIAGSKNTWTKIRIPKQSFSAIGNADPNGQGDTTKRNWAHVKRVLITTITNENGSVNLNFDKMLLHIGTGMHGDYQYAYTYKNSKTGARSNPSLIDTIKNVRRDAVEIRLPGIAALNDPQVDTIEFWRSVGNGSVLFHKEDVSVQDFLANGKHTDIVADFAGLHDEVSSAFTSRLTTYLEDTELPYDNAPPAFTMRDCCGPYQGVVFHIDGEIGKRGNLYYSPPGRPESVAGFIIVTSDDDSLQRCVYWNGIYCFAESGIYEISGTPPGPYTASRIFGAPGTLAPESVVPTPFGICYIAQDGLRMFDGNRSTLVSPEAVLPIFRGETGGDQGSSHAMPAISTTSSNAIAIYAREEYILAASNGVTLAVNLRTGYWREIGTAFTALFAESDTGSIIGVPFNSRKVYFIEQPNQVSDDGTAIVFQVECPGTVVEDQSSLTKLVQRLYLDLNTNGESLTPTIHYSGSNTGVSSLALSPVSTASIRQLIEIALGQPGDIVGVQLTGNILQPVEIFGVYYDLHIPEQGGALT